MLQLYQWIRWAFVWMHTVLFSLWAAGHSSKQQRQTLADSWLSEEMSWRRRWSGISHWTQCHYFQYHISPFPVSCQEYYSVAVCTREGKVFHLSFHIHRRESLILLQCRLQGIQFDEHCPSLLCMLKRQTQSHSLPCRPKSKTDIEMWKQTIHTHLDVNAGKDPIFELFKW